MKVRVDGEQFALMVKSLKNCVAKDDETRPVLNYIYFKVKKGTKRDVVKFEALDGYVCQQVTLEVQYYEQEFEGFIDSKISLPVPYKDGEGKVVPYEVELRIEAGKEGFLDSKYCVIEYQNCKVNTSHRVMQIDMGAFDTEQILEQPLDVTKVIINVEGFTKYLKASKGSRQIMLKIPADKSKVYISSYTEADSTTYEFRGLVVANAEKEDKEGV